MAVAVDLSKTFDFINHNLLLAKLKAYGLSQSALSLMSPNYWVVNREFICTVCAQVIQS